MATKSQIATIAKRIEALAASVFARAGDTIMSKSDQQPDASTSTLAYVEDAARLNLQWAPDAEDAKALGQPVGVYGVGKYGECRWLTKEEIAAQAHKADVPGADKTEA